MATPPTTTVPIELPQLPVPIQDFISYYSSNPKVPISEILEPFKAYESELRKVYAQQPNHEALKGGLTNTVPIFAGHEAELKVRARDLAGESAQEAAKFIMPLDISERKPSGSRAVVSDFKEFQHNFNLFSESSLSDLDWSNVVAAGSAVTTSLLPVPERWADSKRSLREYYHEKLAPASDIDLFLYGMNEEEAIEKIKQIETRIKDSILHETTTIRTKNAITIASQHPTRHVQIVLRLYDSISQVITGFDVDCACAAYDGKQVYASPRALVAFATQVNTIDLSRRSPSYENRLSKYSHRGFEVHWPLLDRSRIDPTIFERSFHRTMGLARLLVLEKLPKSTDRDAYNDQRRKERGRPEANRSGRDQHRLWGNIKDQEEDDVAEWVEADAVSNYHTMVVPYGKRFNAAKINKLLYTKDLLLNAEWNKPKDRDVHLHRHPCFFGDAKDIIEDCCSFCPVPETEEEIAMAEEESRLYISGKLKFIVDDPGRQEIGSFNPITANDWTEMALVGNTQMLSQAIVDGDIDFVRSWCTQEGNDINTRDYVGRTPLHLAVVSSTLEVVQCLIDNGARMVARLVDGRSALHLAASHNKIDIVRALMRKSSSNEEEEDERQERLHAAKQAIKKTGASSESAKAVKKAESSSGESDVDEFDDDSEELDDSDQDSVTMGSFVKIKPDIETGNDIPEDSTDDPDIFDIDVLAWDFRTSPLHLAIINGHVDMIRLLVEEYAADVLLPIKHLQISHTPRSAILTLVLALSLPMTKAKEVVKLLLELGASTGQGDMNEFTALHFMVSENNFEILDILFEEDGPAAHSVLNYVTLSGDTSMTLALRRQHEDMVSKLLSIGGKASISFDDYIKVQIARNDQAKNWSPEQSKDEYYRNCSQPLILAAQKEMPKAIEELLSHGADPLVIDNASHSIVKDSNSARWRRGMSLLDIVRIKIAKLKEYDGEKVYNQEPETFKDEAHYTHGLKSLTYEYFSALNGLRTAKVNNEVIRKTYEDAVERTNGKTTGVKEKQEAIALLIKDLEKVESELVRVGAKTFEEMYPNIPKSATDNNYNGRYLPVQPPPFSPSITFTNVPDLNDRKKAGYLRLFEAVWNDDLAEVKVLTLGSWKSPDLVQNPPLTIATRDGQGFSPFSLAALRGHRTMSKAITEIALAQYEPAEDLPGRRQRWAIDADSDNEDSDSDSGTIGPNIYSTIVDENFTIENVTEISAVVKSHVDPLTMIEWPCMAGWFSRTGENVSLQKICLVNHAIREDDMPLLKFLLEISAEQQLHVFTDEADPQAYSVGIAEFDTAISLGRVAALAEMIKATGVGIPLDELVKKTGVVIKEKPLYYQGLSIAGKKNLQWANRGRDRYTTSAALSDETRPLLKAAHVGSIDSVQFFLSDAPIQKYMEFAAANKGNKKVRTLEQSKDGFEKTIRNWLASGRELALHCAILWNPAKEKTDIYVELVKYLLAAMPESLEYKSSHQLTPIHIAAAIQRPEIVKLLLSAKSNPRTVDIYNRNLIHNMVVPVRLNGTSNNGRAWQQNNVLKPLTDPKSLEAMISLFNEKDVREMLLEKCTLGPELAGMTPLAYWMAKNETGMYNAIKVHGKTDIIEILSSNSSGEDMELINGGGDLPLHQAVKQGLPAMASYLISARPSLLHRENATGRTPLEVASDMYLQERVTKGPTITSGNGFGNYVFYNNDANNSAMVSKAAIEFLPKKENDDEQPSTKRTYEVCVEAAERWPGKRRLVSLFEANEVAKRLAGRKARNTAVDVEGKKDEVKADEVSMWLN